MLAMTIAEEVYGVEVGGKAPPLNTDELRNVLGIDFPNFLDRLLRNYVFYFFSIIHKQYSKTISAS
jgi:hypothetical protein